MIKWNYLCVFACDTLFFQRKPLNSGPAPLKLHVGIEQKYRLGSLGIANGVEYSVKEFFQ